MQHAIPPMNLLPVLLVTGLAIPALTGVRIYIVLQNRSRRKLKRVLGVRWVGEGLLVFVAALSTVQVVLWGWNAGEEMKAGRGFVPGVGYLKVIHASVLFLSSC
jgi:hypothetical protein